MSNDPNNRAHADAAARARYQQARVADLSTLMAYAGLTRIVPFDFSMTGDSVGHFADLLRLTGLLSEPLLESITPLILAHRSIYDELDDDDTELEGLLDKVNSARVVAFSGRYEDMLDELRRNELVRLQPHYTPSFWIPYTPAQAVWGEGLEGRITSVLRDINTWRVPSNEQWDERMVERNDW